MAIKSAVEPVRGAAIGLVLGTLIGVIARLWMRVITTVPPEFTWRGTLIIVAVFAFTGTSLGLFVGTRRRQSHGGLWRFSRFLGLVSILPLCLAAGVVMLPTMVLGGLAVARPDWPRWVRLAPVAAAASFFVSAQREFIATALTTFTGLESIIRVALGLLAGALVYAAVCIGWGQVLRPERLHERDTNAAASIS